MSRAKGLERGRERATVRVQGRRSQVARLLGEGLSRAEIAAELGVTPRVIASDIHALCALDDADKDTARAIEVGFIRDQVRPAAMALAADDPARGLPVAIRTSERLGRLLDLDAGTAPLVQVTQLQDNRAVTLSPDLDTAAMRRKILELGHDPAA